MRSISKIDKERETMKRIRIIKSDKQKSITKWLKRHKKDRENPYELFGSFDSSLLQDNFSL